MPGKDSRIKSCWCSRVLGIFFGLVAFVVVFFCAIWMSIWAVWIWLSVYIIGILWWSIVERIMPFNAFGWMFEWVA